MNKLFSIGALFSCNWIMNFNKLSNNDEYHIRDLKVSGIRYSKRMLKIRSAISIYLLIRELLHKKLHIVILQNTFNYVVPLPET